MKKDLNKKINEVVSKVIDKFLAENYALTDTDELMEYMWLKPAATGLNVDIFVDDGESYLRNNHMLLLFVRNGYDRSVSEFIPISVSNVPMVLDKDMDFNISYDDIFAVQDFIQYNLLNLLKLASKKISHQDFINNIRIPSYNISEKKELLSEMATLRKDDSGLPMDVWLDEGSTYVKHAPRLKFRASNEQRNTRQFSSMLLTNPPEIENLPENTPLRKKDIEKLKAFVINNLEALLDLANGKIDYSNDFLPNLKKE